MLVCSCADCNATFPYWDQTGENPSQCDLCAAPQPPLAGDTPVMFAITLAFGR